MCQKQCDMEELVKVRMPEHGRTTFECAQSFPYFSYEVNVLTSGYMHGWLSDYLVIWYHSYDRCFIWYFKTFCARLLTVIMAGLGWWCWLGVGWGWGWGWGVVGSSTPVPLPQSPRSWATRGVTNIKSMTKSLVIALFFFTDNMDQNIMVTEDVMSTKDRKIWKQTHPENGNVETFS